MGELITEIAVCISATAFALVGSAKQFGALQQCGYKNRSFTRWLKKKDNLYFNRLCLWAGMMFLCSALVSLCFSFGGKSVAHAFFVLPCLLFSLVFCIADSKYALKVPLIKTGRIKRIGAVFVFLFASVSFLVIKALFFLDTVVDNGLYSVFAYLPYTLFPVALPIFVKASNAIVSPFANARNKKFVERAKKKLENYPNLIRVGIVGSYGKTSVKNILGTLLKEKYEVLATPESYNTPIGIAKTVENADLTKTQIFLAEMGARHTGDIKELCSVVRPDYAVFTGVCPQHIETFGSEENVLSAKSEILQGTKKTVVCGSMLTGLLDKFEGAEKCSYVSCDVVKNVEFLATETRFELLVKGISVSVSTPLLAESAVENVVLAVECASLLGLSASEIENGLKKVTPVPHRLQLFNNDGVYILDDGYNANVKGAKEAVSALKRFDGKKIIVTPGIVETGVLEEEIGNELGKLCVGLDRIVLIGDTLVSSVKNGYKTAGGDESKVTVFPTLDGAKEYLANELSTGDCVLFLNDLPDAY